jgi:hypothetical protein
MPASQEDVDAALAVVDDATRVLDWSSASDASLEDESGERTPPVPEGLIDAYRAAIDQAQEEHFQLALQTLRGHNPEFPLSQVLALLQVAGWTGDMRDFKLGVLEQSGRSEVMEVAAQGRAAGGPIRRRIFRGFLGALNAALDSLDGIPGVGAVKELKDFLERAGAK